ncbi:hypothetical protein D6O12_25705, partial [Salmonella enterica]|nr:hypothetical protein [Salmonella enterica]
MSGTAQVDQTEAGFRQPDAELQKPGITGQVGTARHAGVAPGKTCRSLPAPARLLHVLRERPEASPPSQQRHTRKILPQLWIHCGV